MQKHYDFLMAFLPFNIRKHLTWMYYRECDYGR